MNRFFGHLALYSALAVQSHAPAEGLPQSQRIDRSGDNTFLRLDGVPGRTYFFQYSKPGAELEEWLWLPEIRRGTGTEISMEVDGTATSKFFRLRYTDLPVPESKTAETADFDGDGLSNLAEVSIHATDPFLADSDLDMLPDGWEVTYGLNPASAGDGNNLFPGSDITYAEAFQSGLQNHPNATLADFDGDLIPNDEDAVPTDPVIKWSPSPGSIYAWIPMDLPEGYTAFFSNNNLDVIGELKDANNKPEKIIIKSLSGQQTIIDVDIPDFPAIYESGDTGSIKIVEVNGLGGFSDEKDFFVVTNGYNVSDDMELPELSAFYSWQRGAWEILGRPDSLYADQVDSFVGQEPEFPLWFIGHGYGISMSSDGRVLARINAFNPWKISEAVTYRQQGYNEHIFPGDYIISGYSKIIKGGQCLITSHVPPTGRWHSRFWDGETLEDIPAAQVDASRGFATDLTHCPEGGFWIIGDGHGSVRASEEAPWLEAESLKFQFPSSTLYGNSMAKVNDLGEVYCNGYLWRNSHLVPLLDLCPQLQRLQASGVYSIDTNEDGSFLASASINGAVSRGLILPSVIEQYDFETTKATDGIFAVTPADPRPEVNMQLAAAEVNASGQLEVRVTGTVRDQLSEVVEGQRISELRFSVNGEQVKAINLTFGAGQAPWTLADSLNTFDETILISDPKPGGYEIRAETDANAAGNTGWDRVAAGLTREDDPTAPQEIFSQLSVVFSQSLSATTADAPTVYFGNRPPEAGDAVFTETAADSLQFEGSLSLGGIATDCTLRIKEFTTSAGGVTGHFSVELSYTPVGGEEIRIVSSLVESAAGSLRFYPDGFQINAERNSVQAMPDLGGSQGEDIQPLLMKVGIPEALASQVGFRILVNGTTHALKKFTYDGKDAIYVVNSTTDTRPKIFVPCVHALPATNLLPGCDLPGEAIRWEMELGGKTYLLNETLVLPGAQMDEESALAFPSEKSTKQFDASPPARWQQPGDTVTHRDLVDAYKFIYTDNISRALLQVYLQQEHEISLEDVYGDYEFSYHSRPGTKALIKIEHDDNDIHPGICAQYLWRGLTKVLTIYSFRNAVAAALNEDSLEIDAIAAYKTQVGSAAAEVGIAAAELYLSGIGIINEPADWLLVVNDVAEGNYASLTAALPFISTGLVTVAKGIRFENQAGQVLGRLDAESFPALRNAMATGNLETVGTILDQYELSIFIGKLIATDGSKISVPKSRDGLKKAMKRRVLKPGDLFEAHHDLPWELADWFAGHGVNVNKPAFGRWVHKKDHDTWHKGAGGGPYNQFWKDFREEERTTGMRKSTLDILAALEECRQLFPIIITE